MFLPYADDNDRRHIAVPFVTWGLILANAAVFFLQVQGGDALTLKLAFYPRQLFDPSGFEGDGSLSALVRVITAMFTHGGLAHIAGNMLILYIFGDNIEDSLGHTKFLAFYVVCGIGATLAHGLAEPSSSVPMVGASGAIYGVTAAYLLLHPFAMVKVFVWIWIFVRSGLSVPAFVVIGFYIAGDIWRVTSTDTGGGGVASFAHLGGAAVGAALIWWFRFDDVNLLQRAPVSGGRHKSSPFARTSPWRHPPRRRGPWG